MTRNGRRGRGATPLFRRIVSAAPALAALCFWLGAPAASGAGVDRDGAEPRATLMATHRSWDIDDRLGGTVTIRQMYLPFSASAGFGDRFDIVLFGAWARTTLDFGADEAALSGITDSRLKGVWRPNRNTFLSVGTNLPAGKRTLFQGNDTVAPGRPLTTTARRAAGSSGSTRPLHSGTDHREVEVAQAMSSPLLGFRARRMGEGFDLELSGGVAARLSSTVSIGAGAGYAVKGAYDLYETPDGTVDFKPGGEASASAGFDWRPADGALLRLDVAGRTFQDDESLGEKVYRAGTQIEVEALMARVTPKTSVRITARNVVKEDDERFETAGDEILSTAVRSSNSLWAAGEVYVVAVASIALGVEARAGVFGDSDAGLSDGSTAAIGPGVRWSGPRHHVGIAAQWLSGNAEDNTLDLSGLDVSAALTVIF